MQLLRDHISKLPDKYVPGGLQFEPSDGESSPRVFSMVSHNPVAAIEKITQGFDMVRCLSHVEFEVSADKLEFQLKQSVDITLGFYTDFSDVIVDRVELHRTPRLDEISPREHESISQHDMPTEPTVETLTLKNNYCQLRLAWCCTPYYRYSMKVVVYFKRQTSVNFAGIVALDGLIIDREKYCDAIYSGDGVKFPPLEEKS